MSFLVADAVPCEVLIILPIGLQREDQKTITVSSGEGAGASLPGQMTVELDCRSYLLHQVSAFAARLQSTCYTLSLCDINSTILCKKDSFQHRCS